MFYDTRNKSYPIPLEVLCANFPNTSFPPGEFTAPDPFVRVHSSTKPQCNPVTQQVIEGTPVLDDSVWVQGWQVIEIFSTQEEKDAAIAAAQDAASKNVVLAFDTALTAHLDNTAKQRRYDNRITCMVRAGFAGPFQAEGQAFATWCDACNIAAYQMLAAVQAGTAPMPESPQAFIDTLPAMVWPVWPT